MDIIILIFLAYEIGKLAKRKGLSVLKWRFNLVIAWIGSEILGLFFGIGFFGLDNVISWILLAIGFAGTSYILIKNYLIKLPDVISDDDLNNFGK